jgi:hypothetical protein
MFHGSCSLSRPRNSSSSRFSGTVRRDPWTVRLGYVASMSSRVNFAEASPMLRVNVA